MTEFSISVDLSGVIAAHQQVINREVLPLLNQAVRAVAEQTRANWIEAVQRAKLWSGEKDAYTQTIRYQMTGDFSAVVWSDYRHAEAIETGRPARDLKKMLDTSMKVRATKDGKRYLIIPFRHNTPGNEVHARAMPPDVHAQAKDLAPSRVVGQTRRESGTGAYDVKTRKRLTVNQNVYSWGDRLPEGMAPKLHQRHKTAPYAGMYRFDARTPGGNRYSTYMTFRTMMEGSSGWIVPAQPGLYLAKQVADEMRPLAERAFQEAVKRTLG